MLLKSFVRVFIVALVGLLLASTAAAQGLNWEGQTGAFVTPFAYTSSSPSLGWGHPQVAFHFMNGGNVVGNDFQVSVTEGLLRKVEFGYTRALTAAGNSSLNPLFNSGFNIVHGKVNLVSENIGNTKWVPAIATGFVARTQVQRVGGVLNDQETKNGDIYVVATKSIGAKLPILLNVGVKGTNASLLGIAGNSPDWQARGFGAVAFILPGPMKSKLAVGSEFLQQPRSIQGLTGASLPTTLTYFARFIPSTERSLNFDFGVAQAAGRVLPGADVQARARFAFGISYRL